ncbi:MAG: response regulator [Gemmatimonadota bacterium]
MNAPRLLVVDDNRDLADGIAMLLVSTEFAAQVAYSAESALVMLEATEFDVVISDIRMPAMGGLELLQCIRSRWPLTKVVLLTGYGTVDTAVDAMRNGACDYITKPFDNDEIIRILRRALATGSVAGGFDVAAVVGDVAAAVANEDLLTGVKHALDVLVQASGADDGEVFLCEPEGRDSLLSVWTGPDGAALVDRTRFGVALGYPGIVAATGEPLCIKGGLADDARFLRRDVVEAGIRSLVAVPLPDIRGALGSMHVMSRRDDFPVEHVLELLQRAAVPVGVAIRAGLATLRQSVDAVSGDFGGSGQSLRALLESMRQVAGAQRGTLALIDSSTGRPDQVVSTGPASLVCAHAESGDWMNCRSAMAAHGFAADPGRRGWPASCRRGLPLRASSPCCLPLMASGRLFGLVVLDFGRVATSHTEGRLVPLLSMANQLAIRLRSRREGFVIPRSTDAGDDAIRSAPESAELELRCFGPFVAIRRGHPIAAEAFTRSKALVLLKMLALRNGDPVHRDVLIEQIWPDVDPRQGANRLHGVVHDLRSVIEPPRNGRDWTYVCNRGELYYLDCDSGVNIDVARFRQLVGRVPRGAGGRDEETCALLEQAIELYRGDLFADDPFASWCEPDRRELRERYIDALQQLARRQHRGGRGEMSLASWRRALRAAPFREDLLVSQMELLMELGRPLEAQTAYDDHARMLRDELGAVPSEAVQKLRWRSSSG